MNEIHLVIVNNGPQCYMLFNKQKQTYQRVLAPEEVSLDAEIKIVNISTSAVEKALFRLESTGEGPLLRQYINYLQVLLKSTVLSIFPWKGVE